MARSYRSKKRSRVSRSTKGYKKRRTAKRSTRTKYRGRVPRMIQPSTYKHKEAIVSFDYENEFHVVPTGFANSNAGDMMAWLSVMANCPNDVLHDNQDGTANQGTIPHAGFNIQNTGPPTQIGGQTTVKDWYQWSGRYRHFCVIGSKIQVTANPIAHPSAVDGVTRDGTWPWIMHLYKTGGTTGGEFPGVTGDTSNETIGNKPYCKRTKISGTSTTSGAGPSKGGYLSMGYSARSFEGVANVRDNGDLKGTIGSSTAAGLIPVEKTRFVICLKNAITAPTTGNWIQPCDLMLKFKVTYTVRFGEPVTTSDIPTL